MLNGWFRGKRTGSGTIVWEARKLLAAGEINHEQYIEIIASSAPSVGHCNTMGTASTMNALAEAIGMSLPGGAAIPAPHRERAENAYLTGKRIVEMVWEDLRPSKIMTKAAFENMIAVNSAIGGSTNAPIHFNAIAKHLGVKLDNDDWERVGYNVPLIVNMQPAGEYLGEDFHHAGGVPGVVSRLIKGGLINKVAKTVNGETLYKNCEKFKVLDENVIWPIKKPMKHQAGFLNMKGNLFDSAIMKTSVISQSFREKYLSNSKDPNAFEGRAIVFEGPEDYHKRIDDPKLKIDATCMLFVRGVGPIGYPGAAEVVNMQPPARLIKAGIQELPCIGDGRQSGTSGSPSILNASPEAATGGNLAILKTNDIVRVDLNKRSVDIRISKAEILRRQRRLKAAGGHPIPDSQTPWQEIQRDYVDELSEGMVLKPAVKYQKIDRKKGIPRDNH
jgi:dihydroxy-acid dehydratase